MHYGFSFFELFQFSNKEPDTDETLKSLQTQQEELIA